MKKLTTENFIEKACKIHGNEYRLYETLKKNFPNTEIIYQYKNKKIYGRKSI